MPGYLVTTITGQEHGVTRAPSDPLGSSVTRAPFTLSNPILQTRNLSPRNLGPRLRPHRSRVVELTCKPRVGGSGSTLPSHVHVPGPHACSGPHTYTCRQRCTQRCTHMHRHAYIRVCMHVCPQVHMCTQVHMCASLCTHSCIHAHVCTHTCTCVHSHLHAHVHVYAHAQVCTCVHAHVNTAYMHICTCIHVHVHTLPQALGAHRLGHHPSFRPPWLTQCLAPTACARLFSRRLGSRWKGRIEAERPPSQAEKGPSGLSSRC